jgi:uncharacterized membrane protein
MLSNMRSTQYRTVTPTNVGREDRWASLGGGFVLVLLSFWRKSFSSLFLLPVGVYLLYRSLAGHCYLYEALGINTLRSADLVTDEMPPTGVGPYDEVAESSWQSFPTSDAPAWTMGKRD